MSDFILRAYQERAIEQLRQAIRNGHKRIILRAPTGSGKTVIAAAMISAAVDKSKQVLFLARARELVKQCADKLCAFGVNHGVILRGEEGNMGLVQVAGIDTLLARAIRSRKMSLPPADLVFVDECFPEGTMVDGRPIESINVGDEVWSFNHVTNRPEKKRVVSTFRSKVHHLVRIKFRSGRQIVCTPNHPFFVNNKSCYVPAQLLCCTMAVSTIHQQELSNVLSHDEVPCMQKGCPGSGTVRTGVVQEEEGFLLSRASGSIRSVGKSGVYEESKFQVCFGSHESKEPNATGFGEGEGFVETKSDGVEADCSARQRHWTDYGRASVGVPSWMGKRVRYSNKTESVYEWIPDLLQGRYSGTRTKGSHRSRRQFSLSTFQKKTGPKKAKLFGVDWVESVEIYKPSGPGKSRDLCSGSFVCNLEVVGNNNYFAEGVLVHNCHRSTAPKLRELIDRYPDAILIGLTATPARKNGRGLGTLYSHIVGAATYEELIDLGFIVPTRVLAPYRPDLKGVKIKSSGEYEEGEVAKRMDQPKLVGDLYEHWKKYAEDRQTLTFASSIAHSIHIRDEYLAHGVRAAHLDGKTDPGERDRLLSMISSGDLQVLVNVGVCVEGWDCLEIACIQDAAPTASLVRAIQKWGRGMRTVAGKSDLLILDHAGNVFRHGFPGEELEWSLDEQEKIQDNLKKKMKEGKAKTPIVCPNCFTVFSSRPDCPNCGHRVPQYGRKPQVTGGYLEEIDRNGSIKTEQHVDLVKYWHTCLRIAAYKNWPAKRSAGMFKGKTGLWPREVKPPLPNVPGFKDNDTLVADLYPQYLGRKARA